jgi:hypothetical protein
VSRCERVPQRFHDMRRTAGRFADTPNKSKDAELRLRQMQLGTFEEEEWDKTLKEPPTDRFGKKLVGFIGVKWESKQSAETI